MARENNFLLGYGERLSSVVEVSKGGGKKNPPYSFTTARKQVSEWLNEAITDFNELPEIACPKDQVTAVVTMHPRYISKSDFPQELFDSIGVRVVGGRLKRITPKVWGIKKPPEEAFTDELFVIGTRNNLHRWAKVLPSWTEKIPGASHLTHLENIAAFTAKEKIRQIPKDEKEVLLEVILHENSQDIVDKFKVYAKECCSEPIVDRIRFSEQLTFVPVYSTSVNVENLAKFSFVRVVRVMPTMRPLTPTITRNNTFFSVILPEERALNQNARVAVFDGGIPDNKNGLPWVRHIEPDDIKEPVFNYTEHGLAVTSALLFGPLKPNEEAPRPFCNVDHYRVLDSETGANGDFEYYDVLDRILNVLNNAEPYDFINLSLGPDMAINDDEITRWTATLDEKFVGGKTLVTVAAGNSGHLDEVSGLNRIQPPSDAINVLSIGACDNQDINGWKRSRYSCKGPGRCPGIVKPDGVIFGGSLQYPFMVLSPQKEMSAMGLQGTSFASPYALRSAIAVQTMLGGVFNPLTIRALLIHRADLGTNHQFDVGWGRIESDYERLITCDDDEVLVAFQGELPIKDYLRVPLPLPDGKISGLVTVTATLVIAPEIDPSYPNVYTRGGLEVVFRPNSEKFQPGKDGKIPDNAKSKSFFSDKIIYRAAEYNLRQEGHKWEPCLKASQNFRSYTLNEPCFDIYYHKRREGTDPKEIKPMPYAFIVSVKAPKEKNLYNRVVRAYTNILIPLQPSIRIPVRA